MLKPEQAELAMAAIRSRWLEWKTGGGGTDLADPVVLSKLKAQDDRISNADGTGFWDQMNRDVQFDYVWPDLADAEDNNIFTRAYARIGAMALSYKTQGSALYGNRDLIRDIVYALDWMHENRYYAGRRDEGWYALEIGIPLELGAIMLLLDEDLPESSRLPWIGVIDSYGSGLDGEGYAYKGANRVWRSMALLLNGLASRDPSKLERARDGLSDRANGRSGDDSVFKYVTDGDGFYRDGSFIQHFDFAYTAGYGKSMIRDIPLMMYMLKDTPWEVADPESGNVWRWVCDAYEPVIVRGLAMDMVRGREIARESMSDRQAGHQIMEGILLASLCAPDEHAANFRLRLKEWIVQDPGYYSNISLGSIAWSRLIAEDDELRLQGTRNDCRIFAGMDRAVIHRPGWSAGISMNSVRQSYYEYHSFNHENKKAWYTAEGMTYLYTTDLDQYADQFWPTVDPRRLPGITVDAELERSDGSGYSWAPATFSRRAWAGGGRVGAYGAVGMEQDAWGCTLASRKSWFLLDNGIVAIGSAIASGDDRLIETIIDNRKLRQNGEPNRFVMDGKEMPGTLRESRADLVRWTHLEGNVPGSDIGYLFFEPTEIHHKREKRAGSWRELSDYGSEEIHERDYLTQWISHGRNPRSASYAYMILPDVSSEETEACSRKPGISILMQSEAVHAVYDAESGVWAANVWEAAGEEAIPLIIGGCRGTLTVSAPVSILVVPEEGGGWRIGIAEPTQLIRESIAVRLSPSPFRVYADDEALQVIHADSSGIQLSFQAEGAAGRTISAVLRET